MTSVPTGRPLSRNLVVNVVGPLLPMVVSFVTVPLYIHAIGAARYGVVTLTWILLGYLGVLDFGLSRAAANALGRLAHASSRERSSVLITTLYLNLLFGLTASAVFYAIGGALLWRWFPLSGELAHEAVAAFPWMVPMLPLGLLSGVAIGALDSRERFLLATTLNSCGVVLGLVLPLVSVMIFGPSLTVIIPAVMLVRLGVVLAMLTAVFWVERPIHSFAPDFVWARKLFGYGAWVSVSSVISPILDTFRPNDYRADAGRCGGRPLRGADESRDPQPSVGSSAGAHPVPAAVTRDNRDGPASDRTRSAVANLRLWRYLQSCNRRDWPVSQPVGRA